MRVSDWSSDVCSSYLAALEKLAALPVDWLHDDDRLHLAAAADRVARMAEELDSIRERAALMHEALTDLRAEQIDSRSLLISIVALVFLPVTFITGDRKSTRLNSSH